MNTVDRPEMMTQGVIAHILRWFFLCRIPVLSSILIWCYATYFKASFYHHKLSDFDNVLSFFLRNRDLSVKLRGLGLVGGYVSPVEGTVQFVEEKKLPHNSAMPIKGAGFTVSRLVGFEAPFLQSAMVFYLSPGNYHHVHAPTNMVVEDYFELPGALHSVGAKSVYRKKMLYAENYRHVIIARNENDERFVMVLVGAKNIGNISCPKLAGWQPDDEVSFTKGEEIGFFSLGSAVVLLLDRPILSRYSEGQNIDVLDVLFNEE